MKCPKCNSKIEDHMLHYECTNCNWIFSKRHEDYKKKPVADSQEANKARDIHKI